MWSTKVMARLKQQPDPNKAYLGKLQVPVRSIWNDPSTLDNLREAAKWTDHIHFGGGEPLLDHRLWDFLESIVRSDLSISFVSNLNTLPTPRGFELLKSFKTAGINVSIDATGDLYGWMRHGLEYNTVMKNLAMTRSKQIDVAVNCEVQAHNVANMPAHWAEFKKIGVTTDYYFVDKPVLLRARNAPIYILKEAVDELPSDADEQLSHGLRQSIEYHDPEMSAKLINHTTYLNTHRKFTFDCDSWKVFLGK
jgi:MoaA/NifB/PqqE/SkfB family radical SAM enzyme